MSDAPAGIRNSSSLRDYLARLDAATGALPSWRRAELRMEVTDHLDAALADEGAGDGDEAAVRRVLGRLGPPEDIAAAELSERGMAPGPSPAGHTPPGPSQPGPPYPGPSVGQPPGAGPLAYTGPPHPGPAAPPTRRITALEGLAVVFLVIGGLVIPLLGWFVGVVLLWISPRWTVGQKLLGTLVWPGGLALPLGVGLLAARTESSSCLASAGVAAGQPPVRDICTTSGGGTAWGAVAVLVTVVLTQLAVAAYLLKVSGRDAPAAA